MSYPMETGKEGFAVRKASIPKTGGPAFPRDGSNQLGMTLRDYFAGQALTGLLAADNSTGCAEFLADAAYVAADAMLIERKN